MAARLRHQGLGRRFTLGFGGELDLGGLIDQQLEESVPDALLAEKAKQLRQRHPCLERRMRSAEVWGGSISSLLADATVVSLASPFTMHPHRSRVAGGGFKRDARRAHPLNVEVLLDAALDCAVLANDHALDYQEEGLADTLATLEIAGLKHAGAGEDGAAAARPAMLKVMGRNVAIFSVSAVGSGMRDAAGREMWAAAPGRGGIAHVDLHGDDAAVAAQLARLSEAVRVTKEASAVKIHLVVFSLCWAHRLEDAAAGAALDVPADVRAFARGLVDMCGASLVHGHGPSHALGCEVWHGAPILYSLGAVVSDACAGESRGAAAALRPDLSFFASVQFSGSNDVEYVELRPLCNRLLQLNPARGRDRKWLYDAMTKMSAELGGTRVVAAKDVLVLPVTTLPEYATPRPAPPRRPPPPRATGGRTAPYTALEEEEHARAAAAAAVFAPPSRPRQRPSARARTAPYTSSSRADYFGGDVELGLGSAAAKGWRPGQESPRSTPPVSPNWRAKEDRASRTFSTDPDEEVPLDELIRSLRV